MIPIGVFRKHPEAKLPVKATKKAACYDLFLCLTGDVTLYNKLNEKIKRPVQTRVEDILDENDCVIGSEEISFITIEPGDRVLMPTELIFDIPETHNLRFHPRSGLSLKKGLNLANCEAVIDEDYIDPSFVLLSNISDVTFIADHHERLAQMEIVKEIESEVIEQFTAPEPRDSERDGGLGSTGTKS